ncbi:GNAT family N-acetyltransferase [Photobacterium damselae subsp. piscicida]|nr:GNAT family N-acetyltransferase [Photobacterium damselae subsp. piscicida]
MDIKIDNLSDGKVLLLLEEHLADMYATAPPESVHALDVDELKSKDVTFFSCWLGYELMGCVAIKELTQTHAELKSMRTVSASRKLGVATNLLNHIIDTSRARGYQKLSLETGSDEYFKAARNLYEKFGFIYCEPFADYQPNPHSEFMTLLLNEELK